MVVLAVLQVILLAILSNTLAGFWSVSAMAVPLGLFLGILYMFI
jgi:hypothetical protein